MSVRVDSPLQVGAVTVGDRGLGVTASSVPSVGEDGPAFFYDQITSLGLSTEDVRGLVTVQPVSGSLFAYEDGSFTFSGDESAVSFTYQLYVDGVLTGSPQVVSLTIGPVGPSSGKGSALNSSLRISLV